MILRVETGRKANTERRGTAGFNEEDLNQIDAYPGDTIRLGGEKNVVVIAEIDERAPVGVVLVDDLLLLNLGVQFNARVEVAYQEVDVLESITLEAPADTLVPAEGLVRELLTNKPASIGDRLSLVPIDVDEANQQARTRAKSLLGPALFAYTLKTLDAYPASGVVGESTEIILKQKVQTPKPVTTGNPRARARRFANPSTRSGGNLPRPSSPLEQLRSTVDSLAREIINRDGKPTLEPIEEEVPQFTPSVERTAKPQPVKAKTLPTPVIKLEDLPGLEAHARTLEEWLDLGFNQHDLLKQLNLQPKLGVLISGPDGSGKKSLINAVADKLGVKTTVLSGKRLNALNANMANEEIKRELATSGRKVLVVTDVEEVFADENSPFGVMFVDHVKEALTKGNIAVIGTSSKPSKIPDNLRTSGALEQSIVVSSPSLTERRRILLSLTKNSPLEDVDLDLLAEKTPGFVGGDLKTLADTAALNAARRVRGEEKEEVQDNYQPKVTQEDFDKALKSVKASSPNGTNLETGGVTLDQVRGVDEIKDVLTETVLWPLSFPETYARMGIDAPRGVLLFGPPGCGKTYLVKALAATGKANVFSIKGAELLSKWLGDSEANVRDVFRKAREASPSIIFLDEVDALAPARGSDNSGAVDRVIASLLTEMDGVEELKNVVIIGATNRPDLVDPALLRPGRLGKMVFVPPPDETSRSEILKGAAKNVPFAEDVNWEEIAKETESFSAADCAALVQESALVAMRHSKEAETVTMENVKQALSNVKPSLNPVQVAALKEFADNRL